MHRLSRSHCQRSCGHADLPGGQAQNDTHRSQRTNRPQKIYSTQSPLTVCDGASIFLGPPATVLGFRRGALCPPQGVPRNGVAVKRSQGHKRILLMRNRPLRPIHHTEFSGGIAETRSHAGGFLRGADAAGRQPPRAFGQVHRGPSLVGKKHVLRSVSQSLPVTPRRRENRRWAGPSGLATLVCPPDRLFSGQMPEARRHRVKLVEQDLAAFNRRKPAGPSPSNRRHEPLPPRPRAHLVSNTLYTPADSG